MVWLDPCYTPTKISTVTGGSGNTETAAVGLSNAPLHTAVFSIISIPTDVKVNHF